MARIRFLLVLCALAIACGDPLASGRYEGEPLARLHGTIVGLGVPRSINHPYIGIIWFNVLDDRMEAVTMLAAIEAGPLSREFTIDLWDAPPSVVMGSLIGNRMAIGMAVALDDVNGDGRVEIDPVTQKIAPPDRAFGGATGQWLVFLDRTAKLACQEIAFGTTGETPTGLYLADLRSCSAHTELLSRQTPLEIVLFPDKPLFPDDQLARCKGQLIDCTENPAYAWCRQQRMREACFEATCASIEDVEAKARCGEETCAADRICSR